MTATSRDLLRYNTQFRLIDVEGVILDNPDDYIVVREPKGFDEDQTITLEREEDAHGFLYEFSSEDKRFGFHRVKVDGEAYSGYELLEAIEAIKGVDGMVTFQYLTRKSQSDSFTTQYEGQLDFENMSINDVYIEMPSRRITMGDLFRTRKDTKTTISTNQSIDGVPITGPTLRSMFLHAKLLKKDVEAELISAPLNTEGVNRASGIMSGGLLGYVSPVFNDITKEGISTYTTFDPLFSNTSPEEVMGSDMGGDGFEKGKYRIEVDTNIQFYVTISPPFTFPSNNTFDFRFFFVVLKGNGEDIIREEIFQTFTGTFNSSSATFPSFGNFYNVNFERIVDLDRDDRVYMYWQVDDNVNQSHVYNVRLGDESTTGSIEINADLVEDNSITRCFSIKDAVNANIGYITNLSDALESSFLDNEAGEMYMTNGYMLRDFLQRRPETTFNELFLKALQPLFGLGYAVVEDGGDYKVLMEKYEHFYQDVEIAYFDSIEDDSFEIVTDSGLVFNEIKTGYKDYPKSTDENKGNNIDEFNTEHDHLTPIKTVKKSAQYISDYIASGYKIENQRREQFKENPSDTVSDDDKLFIIKGITSDSYNIPVNPDYELTVTRQEPDLLIIHRPYLDIRVGDTINIDTVSAIPFIEGDYYVNSVSILGNKTIMSTDVTTTGFTSYNVGLTVTLPEERLRAERNENMQVLNNLISPDTVYNAGLNPKNMLFNQSVLFNSGFRGKDDSSIVHTQAAKLNGEMQFQFKSGQGSYVRGAGGLITMDGDLELSDINGNARLFTGRLIRFVTNITNFDDVLAIRDACLNQSTNSDNYGYITVSFNGNTYNGFIMRMVYRPLSFKVEFELREKYEPTGGALDYPLDFGLN